MVYLTTAGKLWVNIGLIVLSILIGGLVFWLPYLKKRKSVSLRLFFAENRLLFYTALALVFGFISRTAFLDLLPGGLNQDEASAGYDAYAILKYGIDRNGIRYPVHLVAWGSGQNALYSYLCMPFLLALGVNEISLRLPMALAGCISIFLLYRLLLRSFGARTALLGMLFLVVNPWHLMKSRWALESNLFPELLFFGFYLLIAGLDGKRRGGGVLFSALIFGLSAYSYGTSYFFLFFFVIGTLVYLLVKRKIKWWEALAHVAVVGVVCLPIMAFIYINMFDKASLHFLCFTIPKLTQNRFQAVTNIFSQDFFRSGLKNFADGLSLLFVQYDGLPWNGIPVFGALYLLSAPFTLIGVFLSDKNKEMGPMYAIMRIWLGVALAMSFIVSPNINRLNAVWFPLIFFTIMGLKTVAELSAAVRKCLYALYAAAFMAFTAFYGTVWNQTLKLRFYDSFGEAVECAAEVENAALCYVTPSVGPAYVYVLFYTRYDAREFVATREYSNEGAAFQAVKSFGEYRFFLPERIERGNVYLVGKEDKIYAGEDLSAYSVTYFENYYVIDAT